MITITKTGKGTATVQVNGQSVTARMDRTTRRWEVQMPTGSLWTNSPKLHSIGSLFGQPCTINGQPHVPGTPRTPRSPGAPRQRAARSRVGRRGGPAFAPKPDPNALALEALAKLEDLLVVKANNGGVTDQLEKQFERYQKVKALAMGAGTTTPEQSAAMRLALIEAVKLVF